MRGNNPISDHPLRPDVHSRRFLARTRKLAEGPRSGGSQQFRWLKAQQQHLLPIEYHHVVFTVPDTPHDLFRANPRRGDGLD